MGVCDNGSVPCYRALGEDEVEGMGYGWAE